MPIRSLLAALLLGAPAATLAQAPPPPPLAALDSPAIPAGNPQSAAKIALGSALFWDEQLSRTGTIACGSCHRPLAGGGDPRNDPDLASHPGRNGLFGDADDILGSPGVPQHAASGDYLAHASFGLWPQVGGRNAPSAINAAYSPSLFWDGRAGERFDDPELGLTLIASGGALENQALGPVVNSAEMAHLGGSLADVLARIRSVTPLALADEVPAALQGFIADRGYPALFADAFGDDAVTAARLALAIASYERSLVGDQTPLDQQLRGTPSLTTSEAAGRQVFVQAGCLGCHSGALLSDHQFHYIGVRPVVEDLGRFAESADNRDRGAFRTPSLRNLELSAPYMHNGRFDTIEAVIDFYDRGGDFSAPNKSPRIVPLGLGAQQKADLAAFLRRPLTDPRVAAESGPFERPRLYGESDRVPQQIGSGRPGSGARIPQLVALEPPLIGNDNFTVAIGEGLAGAAATLVVSFDDPGLVETIPEQADLARIDTILDGAGVASIQLALPRSTRWTRQALHARVYVVDPAAEHGVAVSAAVRFTPFDLRSVVMRDGFD